jgi:hypothetical protein
MVAMKEGQTALVNRLAGPHSPDPDARARDLMCLEPPRSDAGAPFTVRTDPF